MIRSDFRLDPPLDTLIQCARNVFGFEEKDRSSSKKCFKTSGTAIHCGYELKRAAVIVRCQALRKMNLDKKNEIDIFLKLFDAEWYNRVIAPAMNNLSLKKHHRPEVLLTEDILEVRKYIIEHIIFYTKKVKKSVAKENWSELAEVTLSKWIMFKKMQGHYHTFS